jgi:hypothetical protein
MTLPPVRRPSLSRSSKLYLLNLDNEAGKAYLETFLRLFVRRIDKFIESRIEIDPVSGEGDSDSYAYTTRIARDARFQLTKDHVLNHLLGFVERETLLERIRSTTASDLVRLNEKLEKGFCISDSAYPLYKSYLGVFTHEKLWERNTLPEDGYTHLEEQYSIAALDIDAIEAPDMLNRYNKATERLELEPLFACRSSGRQSFGQYGVHCYFLLHQRITATQWAKYVTFRLLDVGDGVAVRAGEVEVRPTSALGLKMPLGRKMHLLDCKNLSLLEYCPSDALKVLHERFIAATIGGGASSAENAPICSQQIDLTGTITRKRNRPITNRVAGQPKALPNTQIPISMAIVGAEGLMLRQKGLTARSSRYRAQTTIFFYNKLRGLSAEENVQDLRAWYEEGKTNGLSDDWEKQKTTQIEHELKGLVKHYYSNSTTTGRCMQAVELSEPELALCRRLADSGGVVQEHRYNILCNALLFLKSHVFKADTPYVTIAKALWRRFGCQANPGRRNHYLKIKQLLVDSKVIEPVSDSYSFHGPAFNPTMLEDHDRRIGLFHELRMRRAKLYKILFDFHAKANENR